MGLETEKELETEVTIEKIFFLAISDVADILSPPPQLRKVTRTHKKREIPAKILRGESFPERDYTIRSLAAKAYEVAKSMEDEGDREAQLKWMKLVARLVFSPRFPQGTYEYIPSDPEYESINKLMTYNDLPARN